MSDIPPSAERILDRALQEFAAQQRPEQVRVWAGHRVVSDEEAAFLLQIDEYDVSLHLLATSAQTPSLTEEQLRGFKRSLLDNPNTVALVLVWTTNDLLAIPLTLARVDFLLHTPHTIPRLLRQARPVQAVLEDILNRQSKSWESSLEPSTDPSARALDPRATFIAVIEQAIETESGRSYRIGARKQAAQFYDVEREKRVIINALNAALDGASSEQIVSVLTDLRMQTSRA
ncbi:MAG: hypothetical protein ACRERD_22255 [Candidatus Binatia bacterium]